MFLLLVLLALLFLANFDQFNADVPSDDINMQSSDVSSSLPAVASTATAAEGEADAEVEAEATTAPTTETSSPPPPSSTDVDPFETVDPFASHSDVGSAAENSGWFQPSTSDAVPAAVDPFVPKFEPVETAPVVASPKVKKAAPKANPSLKGLIPIHSSQQQVYSLSYRYLKTIIIINNCGSMGSADNEQ